MPVTASEHYYPKTAHMFQEMQMSDGGCVTLPGESIQLKP